MPSVEEGTLLHTCVETLRESMMACWACCFSICQKDDDPQEHIVNEHTRLLQAVEQQQDLLVPVPSAVTPPRKPDEQSALNRILHETATNVIDVGALGAYALEQSVYSERVRAYTARLATVPPVETNQGRLLTDVAQGERQSILNAPPPQQKDVMLITSAVKRAAAALSELHVEHHEELVVPFRVP